MCWYFRSWLYENLSVHFLDVTWENVRKDAPAEQYGVEVSPNLWSGVQTVVQRETLGSLVRAVKNYFQLGGCAALLQYTVMVKGRFQVQTQSFPVRFEVESFSYGNSFHCLDVTLIFIQGLFAAFALFTAFPILQRHTCHRMDYPRILLLSCNRLQSSVGFGFAHVAQ